MIFKIEDIGYDTAHNALADHGFGLSESKSANKDIVYTEVWTQNELDGVKVPGGYRVGQIVRATNSFGGIYTLEITEHCLYGRDGSGRERIMKVLSQIINRTSLR